LFQAEFVAAFSGLVSTFQTELRRLLTISADFEKLVSLDALEHKFSELDLANNSTDSNKVLLEDGDQVQVFLQKIVTFDKHHGASQLYLSLEKFINKITNYL
jgi:hypothetical protein